MSSLQPPLMSQILSRLGKEITTMQNYMSLIEGFSSLKTEQDFVDALKSFRKYRDHYEFPSLPENEKKLEGYLVSQAIYKGYTDLVIKQYRTRECYEETGSYLSYTLPTLETTPLKMLMKVLRDDYIEKGYKVESVRSAPTIFSDPYHIDIEIHYGRVNNHSSKSSEYVIKERSDSKAVTEGEWAR